MQSVGLVLADCILQKMKPLCSKKNIQKTSSKPGKRFTIF